MRNMLLAVLLSLAATASVAAAEPCADGGRTRRGHGLRHWLRHRECLQLDCGAGKTHHEFGCTGCKGECIFVFGSCWEFFEEPCYPKPPPPSYPYPYPYPYPYQRPPAASKPLVKP